MRRIKIKKSKYYKISKKEIILRKFLIILTLVVFFSFLLIHLFSTKATPILLKHAELEAKKLATVIINRAISNQIATEINLDELIITTKNDVGEIQTIDFNPYIVNKVLNAITNSVQLNLKWLQEGKINLIELPDGVTVDYNSTKLKEGIIYEIPIGLVTQNSFLSNLGPKIPVKLNLVGSVQCNVNTKVNEYGINNAMVEISIRVKVSEKIILPFASKLSEIETDIPVAIKIINGKVPNYYSNGLNKNSDIFSIPIQ